MKSCQDGSQGIDRKVAPARERGLKFVMMLWIKALLKVAPARERGLKYEAKYHAANSFCRSREGAWIEIRIPEKTRLAARVAPARERGLKSHVSRKPAKAKNVAPARERGLKLSLSSACTPALSRSREGAWIEILVIRCPPAAPLVAPARERGLKYEIIKRHLAMFYRSSRE